MISTNLGISILLALILSGSLSCAFPGHLSEENTASPGVKRAVYDVNLGHQIGPHDSSTCSLAYGRDLNLGDCLAALNRWLPPGIVAPSDEPWSITWREFISEGVAQQFPGDNLVVLPQSQQQGTCGITIMVRLNSNSDRATWWDVDRSAYEVVTRCIHDQRNPELDPVPPRGGYALFGEHNDLIVYVYNPNSDFARELMIEILENNLRADATGKCKAIDCPGPIKGKFEGPNDKDIGGGTTSSEDDDDYDDQVAMVDAPESFSDQDAAFTVYCKKDMDCPVPAFCNYFPKTYSNVGWIWGLVSQEGTSSFNKGGYGLCTGF